MKRIIAIVAPELEPSLLPLLSTHAAVNNLQVAKINQHNPHGHTTYPYRGRKVSQPWQARLELCMLVPDARCDAVINLLLNHALHDDSSHLIVQDVAQVIDLQRGHLHED